MSELAAVVRCLLGLLNTPMAASDAAHTRRAGIRSTFVRCLHLHRHCLFETQRVCMV